MPGIGHRRDDLTDYPVLFWPVGTYLIICRAVGPLRLWLSRWGHGTSRPSCAAGFTESFRRPPKGTYCD